MRKSFNLLYILVFFLILCSKGIVSNAADSDWCKDYKYTLDEENRVIKITAYNGNDEAICIPATAVINGVTYDTEMANFNCKNTLKSISFEEGVVITKGDIFSGGSYLESVDLTGVSIEGLTSLSSMFEYCLNLKEVDFTGFGNSGITDMSNMFSRCESLEVLDLSNLDMSQVQHTEKMFYGCRELKTIDFGDQEISNITNLNYMFYSCTYLQELDLSKFDLSKTISSYEQWQVTRGCYELKKVKTPVNVPENSKLQFPNLNPNKYVDSNGVVYTLFPHGEDSAESKEIVYTKAEKYSEYAFSVNKEDKKVSIRMCNGDGGDLVVPATMDIEGVQYKVRIDQNCLVKNVRKLSFEEGVVIWATSFKESEFEILDLTGAYFFDTSTSQHFLLRCKNLKQIIWGDTFDINGIYKDISGNEVTGLEYFVGDCISLKELDLSQFDTSKMKDLWYLCSGCTSLEMLNLKGCSFESLRDDNSLFYDLRVNECAKLKYIYAPIKVPAGAKIKLPDIFVDENGNIYDALPTGLEESILLYSFTNTKEAREFLNLPEDTTWQNDFDYEVIRKRIEIYDYLGNEKDIEIPQTAIVYGQTYSTWMYGGKYNNSGKISFEEGVVAVTKMSFENSQFKEIDLTGLDFNKFANGNEVFNNCQRLVKITVPDNFSCPEEINLPKTFKDEDGNEYDVIPKTTTKKLVLTFGNVEDESDEDEADTESSSDSGSSAEVESSSSEAESGSSAEAGSSSSEAESSSSAEVGSSSSEAESSSSAESESSSAGAGSSSETDSSSEETLKDTTWQAGYGYTLNESEGTITLVKHFETGSVDINIPAKAVIGGKEYKVVIKELQLQNTGKVTFGNGVILSGYGRFARSKFREIDFSGVYSKNLFMKQHMFSRCENLEKITWGDTIDLNMDLRNNNASTEIGLEYMVAWCPKLKEIDLSVLDIDRNSLAWLVGVFEGCDSLEKINMGGIDLSSYKNDGATYLDTGLSSCHSLKQVYAPINLPEEVKLKLPYRFVDEAGNIYTELPTNLTHSIMLYAYTTPKAREILNLPEDTKWQKDFDYDVIYSKMLINDYIGNEKDVMVKHTGIVDGEICETWVAGGKYNNSGKLSFEEGVLASTSLSFKDSLFEEIDLSGLDFSKLRNGENVFTNCERLTKITVPTGFTCPKEIELPTTFKDQNGNMYKSLPLTSESQLILTAIGTNTNITAREDAENGPIAGTSDAENGPTAGTSDAENGPTAGTPDAENNTKETVPESNTNVTSGNNQKASSTNDVINYQESEKVRVGTSTYAITGDGNVIYTAPATSNTKTVTIPKTITINGKTYKVSAIDSNAFKDCKNLKKLSIPSTIVKIGNRAFSGCKKIKTITIKVNKKLTISKNAFKGVNKKAVITLKGIKGEAKTKLIIKIKKQTKADVK